MGTPSQLAWMERGLRALAEISLTEHQKSQVLLLLNGFIFWDARVVSDMRHAAENSGVATADSAAALGELFRTLAESDQFPALRKAVEAGTFEGAGMERFVDDEAEFTFGLDRILDGIDRLVTRRASAAPVEGDQA